MQRVLTLALLLTALAGCAGDDGSPEPAQEPTEAMPDPIVNGTVPLEITLFDADVTAGVPATANFTLEGTSAAWRLDADGDGEADASGDALPATSSFTYEAAGNFTATLTLERGNETVDASLSLVITETEAPVLVPAAEQGSVASSTAGAPPQAIIGRVPFTISEGHATLEVTTFLEDPAASELGQTYVVRLTPPSGGNDDHTVAYGETITIVAPEGGGWEIGIFPSGAGAWDWTADYCAFTDGC